MLRRWFLASLAAAPAGTLRAQAPAHPRLFLDAKRVERLREEIQSSHAALWKSVRQLADSYAARTPPEYSDGPDPNDEQLWQREVGNKLPFLAMAHLLTRNPGYLEAAARWSLASCAYPHWGAGREDGVDLAAGHQLFGLALVYDWLYPDLAPDARQTIRRTLLERGRVMYDATVNRAYWRNSFLQNHLWVNAAGLAAAGLALDEEPEVRDWIELARDKFRRTEAALGPDGASHEGVGYWSYGVEYMLKFWHLASELLGENLSSSWWKNTAAYRLHLGLPRNSWTATNAIVDLADCPRWDWYGPEYLLRRLAAMHGDAHAQWLAAELERAGVTQYAARWLNLVWYDPAIEPRAPSDLPTLRHFEDLGIVAARADWSGDESLVVFKCGPPIGHEATEQFTYDPGSGHVHPDANHFVLFGGGEWLLRDEGYAWKQTDHHNTLLVDGKGQLGEDVQWFYGMDAIRVKAHPRVLKAESSPELDEIVGDATPIYRRDTGVKRFVRRLYFLKPDVLIVMDEIEVDGPRRLELRFHPEYPFERQEGGVLLARGRKAVLRMESLTPEGVVITAGETTGKDRDGKSMLLHAVRLEMMASAWRNVVAFSWSAAGGEPVRVSRAQDAHHWIFGAGGRSVKVARS
jgi:heparinase II/III-like protein/uncharacterized protein DUF4962